MESKRGLSEIISSVLLILVVIVAIGLISYFVVPMIKDNLYSSKGCFDLNEYFKVSGNSCSNDANTILLVERGMQDLEVSGFSVSITDSNGESKNYQIKAENLTQSKGVQMVTGETLNIVIPNAGESKKYNFTDVSGSKISIAALQKNGKTCNPSEFTIDKCS